MRDIVVHFTRQFEKGRCHLPRLRALIKSVCRRFGLSKAAVGVTFVNNEQIRSLNKKFLNKNSVTDCLSFELSDEGAAERSFELIVNVQKAASQAKRRGHSEQAELALYVTHGLLHNLGFDDSTDEDAARMHETEDGILLKHGFGVVYNKGN